MKLTDRAKRDLHKGDPTAYIVPHLERNQMSDGIRLEHRILASGEHCVTSPDVRGLCAIADTEAEARREAGELLAIFERLAIPLRKRTNRVEHDAA